MRAVVGTNLLLRMAASGQQLPLYRAWRQREFTLVISSTVVDEFARVMERPKVRRFLPSGRAQAFVALLRSLALFVEPVVDFPDGDLVTRLDALTVEVIQAGEFLARLHS